MTGHTVYKYAIPGTDLRISCAEWSAGDRLMTNIIPERRVNGRWVMLSAEYGLEVGFGGKDAEWKRTHTQVAFISQYISGLGIEMPLRYFRDYSEVAWKR